MNHRQKMQIFNRGYAQALADFWRQHHDKSGITFKHSGLTLEELVRCGVEEYDLKAIREAIS